MILRACRGERKVEIVEDNRQRCSPRRRAETVGERIEEALRAMGGVELERRGQPTEPPADLGQDPREVLCRIAHEPAQHDRVGGHEQHAQRLGPRAKRGADLPFPAASPGNRESA